MPESFDPYHRWLGVRPEEQPANHYRLLGLALFEDNCEAIRDAAERQMAHVRRYQLGPHSAISQTILNELAAAKACLLDTMKKAAYDGILRGQLAATASAAGTPPPLRQVTAAPTWRVKALAGACAILACIVATWLLIHGVKEEAIPSQVAGKPDSSPQSQQSLPAGTGEGLPPSSSIPLSADESKTAPTGITEQSPRATKAESPAEEEPPTARSEANVPKVEKPGADPLGTAAKDSVAAEEKTTLPSPEKQAAEKEHPPKVEDGRRTEPMPPSESSATEPRAGLDRSFTNSLGMKFVLIPSGEFMMGTSDAEISRVLRQMRTQYRATEKKQQDYLAECIPGERPRHRVKISMPFYLAVYEVTQAEYNQIMNANPSFFAPGGGGKKRVSGQDTRVFPVDSVNWDESREFCERLSAVSEERAHGRNYRLPTEAEWEYACRAESTTAYCFGTNEARLAKYAWFADTTAHAAPQPVGQKEPNALGLYDCYGNVYEWCADWYDKGYYGVSPGVDPKGPSLGDGHVARGGSWDNLASVCRSAFRVGVKSQRNFRVGFRVACDVLAWSKGLQSNGGSSDSP